MNPPLNRWLAGAFYLLLLLCLLPSLAHAEEVSLVLKADRSQASVGDVVRFSGSFHNHGTQDRNRESGSSLYLEIAPPRGFTVDLGSGAGTGAFLDSTTLERVNPRSDRLLRFGPFDVPADGTLDFSYQATVGLDTKEGRYQSRVRAIDSGGVSFAAEAVVTVAVTNDRDFATSVILARVFCDEDYDGEQGVGEAGLYGARVYADTGAFAVTDLEGRAHFTRIEPGAHLFKLDTSSLAGGTVLGRERQLLRLSEGLGAQLQFAVECAQQWVGAEHAQIRFPVRKSQKPAPRKSMTTSLRGRLDPMSLEVNGRRLDLPVIDLKTDFPASLSADGQLLPEVPPGGFATEVPRWSVLWNDDQFGTPASWRFTIERVDEGGSAPVLHREGEGAPPSVISWDGLSDAGTEALGPNIYVARATMISTDGVEVATARHPFGLGLIGAQRHVLRGEFFNGDGEPTQLVLQAVGSVVEALGAQGQLMIEVHGDGTGDRLKAVVETQLEARLIGGLFESRGIPSERISVRGRGSSELLDSAATAAAADKNRRVILLVSGASKAGPSVLAAALGKPEMRVNGRLLALSPDGSFESSIKAPLEKRLLVQLQAASGRRIAFHVSPGQPTISRKVEPARRSWKVSGDLKKENLQIDFDVAPRELWGVNAQLVAVGGLPIPELQTEQGTSGRALNSALDIRLLVAKTLGVSRWQLLVADASGLVVHRESQQGPVPEVLRWDGTVESSLVLKPNQRYQYWLEVETDDSSSVTSAPRWFHVDPAESVRLLQKSGRFFRRSGALRSNLRNLLSRLVTRRRRRAKERYAIVLEVVGDAPRVRMVRQRFASYLTRLGLQAKRYNIQTREITGSRDRISIVVDRQPPKSVAEVRINGRRVAIDDGQFDEEVSVARSEPITVALTTETGAKLRYVASRPMPSQAETAGGELIVPALNLPESETQRSTPASSLRVLMPVKGTVLGERNLAVSGTAPPGSSVLVNGAPASVDGGGRFHVITPLPTGPSEISIRADDVEGGSSTLRWPVYVAQRHQVVVAMVEGIAASSLTSRGWLADTATIAGMGRDTTFNVGALSISTRARAYLKARMPGGPLSEELELTAHLDTGRQRSSSVFFETLDDPVRDYLSLGDASEEVQDVNTKGKLYVHLKAGASSAVVGSIHTDLSSSGDLFAYNRTADGALVDLRRAVGDNEIRVRGFTTVGTTSSSRDANWFRATGGSLYYLRHSHVVEGSEIVRVVVRDRDSGLPLSETVLKLGRDYSVDYEGGRVQLREPLASVGLSTWLINNVDASTMGMSSNIVYLSVGYEHEDQDGRSQRAAGVYLSSELHKRVQIGAGVASEERDGVPGYRLWGADALVHLGKVSTLRAEIAGSKQRDAAHWMSLDGGLSFGALQRDSAFDSNDGRKLGWKIAADLAGVDVSKRLAGTHLSLYVQDIERGFAAGDTVLEQGRLKFGARAQHRLSSRDLLRLRHEGYVALLPRVGPTSTDVDANPAPELPDERASYLTSIQWARDDGAWHYKLEGMHQRLSSTAALANDGASLDSRRLGAGAFSSYDVNPHLTVRVGQQLVANTRDADVVLDPLLPSGERGSESLAGVVSSVGSDLWLTPDLKLATDIFQRWNGDISGRLGLRSKDAKGGSVYLQEQVAGVGGKLQATTVVGAEERFGADQGGRRYGEYQLGHGTQASRNRAVLGIGRRWQVVDALGLGLGIEHQQAFGGRLPDGTPLGDAKRNLLHSSFDFATASRFRLLGRFELRMDQGGDSDPELLGDDPRPGLPPGGFADHGGVAPGAALLIGPGRTTQWLVGLTADWRLFDDHTWFARGRFSNLKRNTSGAEAGFRELTTGWAYRPAKNDSFEMLGRYSYLQNRRVDAGEHSERSHVLALLPMWRLPASLQLSGKVALKHTAVDEKFGTGDAVETHLTAILSLLRLGFVFYGNWDLSTELRQLAHVGNADDEVKRGVLFELGYTLGQHLRLGGGYNLSRFSDNELGDLDRDSHGFFIRMTGQY